MEATIKEQTLKIEQLEKNLEKLKDGKQIRLNTSENQREYLVEVRHIEKLIRLEKEKLNALTSENEKEDSGRKDITGKLDFVGKMPKNPRN